IPTTSWQPDNPTPIDSHAFATGQPDVLLAGAMNGVGPRSRKYAIFRSKDGGATWSLWLNDAAQPRPVADRPGAWFAYRHSRYLSDDTSWTLLKMTDDGATW